MGEILIDMDYQTTKRARMQFRRGGRAHLLRADAVTSSAGHRTEGGGRTRFGAGAAGGAHSVVPDESARRQAVRR